jgi:hypothetical protein
MHLQHNHHNQIDISFAPQGQLTQQYTGCGSEELAQSPFPAGCIRQWHSMLLWSGNVIPSAPGLHRPGPLQLQVAAVCIYLVPNNSFAHATTTEALVAAETAHVCHPLSVSNFW